MASDTLYVNKPGGVIVQTKAGGSVPLAYGAVVPVDQLKDHVDPSTFSDSKPRLAAADLVADAHRRAALAENGQVNSSSSPVPGNYNDLDEDTAARLVQNLAAYPEGQLAILKHEVAFKGGRQKVIDAAGEFARQHVLSFQAPEMGTVEGPLVTGTGDPTRGGVPADREALAQQIQARAARVPAPTSAESDGELKGQALDDAVDAHNAALPEDSDQRILKSASAQEKRDALAAAQQPAS
jgi:hypothetical protein